MIYRQIITCMAGVLVGLLAISTAQAALTTEIRLAGDASSLVLKPGDLGHTITMYVWARATGASDTYYEGVQFGYWSVWSKQTLGGAVNYGAITVPTYAATFNNGAIVGAAAELSATADHIMDRGALTRNANANMYRSSGTPPVQIAVGGGSDGRAINSSVPAQGWEWNVATVDLMFTSAALTGSTSGGSTTIEILIPGTYLVVKASTYYEDITNVNPTTGVVTGTLKNTNVAGASITFTLEQTEVLAHAGGVYTVGPVTNASLTGSGEITKGFGTVATKWWNLDGDAAFETPQPGANLEVTYDMLKGLGYAENETKIVKFKVVTNDLKESEGQTTMTLLPEPATMALMGLGLAAVAGRRRVRR